MATPRQVLLFAGHRIDAPGRTPPRFPTELEPAAREAIEAQLQQLDAGPQDLALTQGAAGGDLLFAEACMARHVPLQLLLPLPEADFARASLLSSADGARWQQRFEAVVAALPEPPRVLAPTAGNAFERCNDWLLQTAQQQAGTALHFICLWDGGRADGPGGTEDMVERVRRAGGHVHWIDTRQLRPVSALR